MKTKKETLINQLSKEPSYILENIIKSLSNGVSIFLNDKNDEIRLEAAKSVLNSRKK